MARTSKQQRGYAYGTPVCPANPDHGQMLDIRGMEGYWCPHVEHEGRLKSHPDGKSPRTKSRWTLDEIAALNSAAA
jgi:hypothetical protein